MPEARVAAMPPIVQSAPGSTGKVSPVLRKRLVQLQARDAGFDRRVEIVDADAQHVVHLAQIDRDAAVDRVDVAFERRAGAERDDRHAMGRADRHDRGDLVRRVREADDVGQRGEVVGLAVAVMIADRRRFAGARAQQMAERIGRFECEDAR